MLDSNLSGLFTIQQSEIVCVLLRSFKYFLFLSIYISVFNSTITNTLRHHNTTAALADHVPITFSVLAAGRCESEGILNIF